MKKQLIKYLATGVLVAGSLLPFGCEKRSLEGKINQPGVQATQPVYEDPVLTRVMGKLRQEYEKFDISQLSEEKRKWLENEIKKEKPKIIAFNPPIHDSEIVREFYRKSGFINVENPTKKDLAFTMEYSDRPHQYLKDKKEMEKIREEYKKNPGKMKEAEEYKNSLFYVDILFEAGMILTEKIDAWRKNKGVQDFSELSPCDESNKLFVKLRREISQEFPQKSFEEFIRSRIKTKAKEYRRKYEKFPLNLKKTVENLEKIKESYDLFSNYTDNLSKEILEPCKKGVIVFAGLQNQTGVIGAIESGLIDPENITQEEFIYLIEVGKFYQNYFSNSVNLP